MPDYSGEFLGAEVVGIQIVLFHQAIQSAARDLRLSRSLADVALTAFQQLADVPLLERLDTLLADLKKSAAVFLAAFSSRDGNLHRKIVDRQHLVPR